MDIEYVRNYCLSLPHTTEDMPFGDDTLVFRVGGKIYGLMGLNSGSINLKCDPERVEELRENHHYVLPGYHMNKKHWNTVLLNDGIEAKFFRSLIDHSYDLIFQSLSKKIKETLVDPR